MKAKNVIIILALAIVMTIVAIILNSKPEVKEIRISTENLLLKTGDSEMLSVLVFPNDATDENIVWESSDSNIVSVNNGWVLAKKEGKAIVSAIVNENLKATCRVIVSENIIEVSNIALNVNKATMQEGEQLLLSEIILPNDATNKKVIWESSNPKVAVVNNGRVVALKKGSASIIAIASNGKVATCRIEVYAKEVVKPKARLNKENIILNIGDSDMLILDNLGNNKVTWKSSDSSIVAVDNGRIVANKVGSAVITAVTSDGQVLTCKVTVGSKYNITLDPKLFGYEQAAACVGETMSYRIIRINSNFYALIWVSDANKQINNGLANTYARGVASIEEIFLPRALNNKCFIGVNASFFDGNTPGSKLVLSEGRIAKNNGNSSTVIGINQNNELKVYMNKSFIDLLLDGVRNTFVISSPISHDNGKVLAHRTQIFQYDENNFIIYSGYGTVASGLSNVRKLVYVSDGYNLDGGGSRKLYYKTKTGPLIKLYGGERMIPDTLYISE